MTEQSKVDIDGIEDAVKNRRSSSYYEQLYNEDSEMWLHQLIQEVKTLKADNRLLSGKASELTLLIESESYWAWIVEEANRADHLRQEIKTNSAALEEKDKEIQQYKATVERQLQTINNLTCGI